MILHHGFTSHAADNATHAKFFHEQGYEVLLLDLRAHGESEGDYVGFGILDRFDTLEWVRCGRKRFGADVKVVLHGTSMGGATALMALGLPEIQETVSAVIADCAYTSPADIFSHVIQEDYHLPPAPIIALTSAYSQSAAGYRFDTCSTLDALKDNRVPVLFIHGKEDKFVPTWMSEKNFNACSCKKRLLLVDKAGHGFSALENPSLYEQAEKNSWPTRWENETDPGLRIKRPAHLPRLLPELRPAAIHALRGTTIRPWALFPACDSCAASQGA